jgi:hypothetical protein
MGFIQDVIDGVKMMIDTFKKIICFLTSVPRRISNLNAGFENVFNGINAEFEAIGKSFNMGVSSINVFGKYIGEFISTYIGCGFKFFQNFFDCVFYYIVDIILYICTLPITIMFWACNQFFGVDMTYIQVRIRNGLITLNDTLYPYLGFHIIHWPKDVRENCYLCKRLKVEAVTEKANDVGVTFNEKIPNNFGKSRSLFRRGKRQFEEIFKTIVRPPSEVTA